MKTISDTRLNSLETRQINNMTFTVKSLGELYLAAMYDRPNFTRQDSPVARGTGDNIHEAKLAAFLEWSRR